MVASFGSLRVGCRDLSFSPFAQLSPNYLSYPAAQRYTLRIGRCPNLGNNFRVVKERRLVSVHRLRHFRILSQLSSKHLHFVSNFGVCSTQAVFYVWCKLGHTWINFR